MQLLLETRAHRWSGSLGVSLIIHAVIVGAFFWVALVPGQPPDVRHATPIKDVVWLQQPGPGGGGGGGGNRSVEPPRKEKLAVPKQSKPEVKPVEFPENALPSPDYLVPVKSQLDESLVGLSDIGASRGPGTGDGMGKGKGSGIGDGMGPGIGDGSDGGMGDGPFRPGNGVENPILKKEVKPEYTAEAMSAKIQGTAALDCVVKADGTVGQCRIVRSLDSTFGLDQKAIAAARQWRFLPARQRGQPVAMWVTIELQFTLR